MIRLAAFLLSTLCCLGCRTAAPAPGTASPPALVSAEMEELAALEDARSLGNGRIEALTRAPSVAIRERALLALGRLQVPRTAGVIAAALDDRDARVRAMAAFALGQLGLAWTPVPPEVRALAERRLNERLVEEEDRAVRARIVEALGKVGTEKSLDALVAELSRGGGVPAEAARALGVLAKSSDGQIVSGRATLQAEYLLRAPD
ncbi:MAG: HEAT repeat domain-containing protein, partial [Myxococcales bacterium]